MCCKCIKSLPDHPGASGSLQTIADLTKERLRRAGKKIKDENPMFAGDLGFRVFKLDSSNIRAWEPDRDNLEQTLVDSHRAPQDRPHRGGHPLRAAPQARPGPVRAHREADDRGQAGPHHRRRRAAGLPRRRRSRATRSSRWRWASSNGTRRWPRPGTPPASSATAPSPTTWPRPTSPPSSTSTG